MHSFLGWVTLFIYCRDFAQGMILMANSIRELVGCLLDGFRALLLELSKFRVNSIQESSRNYCMLLKSNLGKQCSTSTAALGTGRVLGSIGTLLKSKAVFSGDRTLSCSGSEGRGIPPQFSTQVPTTFTVGNELGVSKTMSL